MAEITGRDQFILLEALATALVALEHLPARCQPASDMDDMRALLAHYAPSDVTIHLADAKRRLFPDLNPDDVRRSYGLED